jgi:hypothetical protein
MIGKGAQYLTAAGFGRYRITAASLGNLDLLGTWRWLTIAAKQAIVGAFGQRDGKAVIKATNAYLDQLAASDKDKATALAGFINEDPMMVCSLGLQPDLTVLPSMPIRFLDNGGTAFIDLGVIPNGDPVHIDFLARYKQQKSSFQCFIGNESTTNNPWIGIVSGTKTLGITYGNGWTRQYSETIQPETFIDLAYYNNPAVEASVTINGTSHTLSAYAFTAVNHTLRMFSNNNGGSGAYQPLDGQIARLRYRQGNNIDIELLPIKRSNVLEYIDLNSGNLATRVGTFTEAFYLPDGTPWTPSTP